MARRRNWLVLLPILAGCENPSFDFRGYTNLSGCREVIDAELANGSEFLGSYDSTDFENPGQVTELSGEIFAVPVRIDITCSEQGRVRQIHYLSPASTPDETAAVFLRFANELSTLFGMPFESVSEFSLGLRFGCEGSAPIMLEDWVLPEDDSDDTEPEVREHEVYIAIVPSAAPCTD